MSVLSSTCRPRGAFIVFEGIDRCGKTTQCKLLTDYFNKDSTVANAEFIRYPNRESTIGQLINSYLSSSKEIDDHTIHLLFSANRWESKDSILNKLKSGKTLICDRYAYSGVAFTSAKGLDYDWCKSCDKGLPSPDCVIYLDIPIEEAAQRGNYGEERYEKIDFQKKVREMFMRLHKDNSDTTWHILDARKNIEELHQEIINIVNKINRSKNISELWN